MNRSHSLYPQPNNQILHQSTPKICQVNSQPMAMPFKRSPILNCLPKCHSLVPEYPCMSKLGTLSQKFFTNKQMKTEKLVVVKEFRMQAVDKINRLWDVTILDCIPDSDSFVERIHFNSQLNPRLKAKFFGCFREPL